MILLMNLLIAVMGSTYNTRVENAALEWRWEMARLVLRMELLSPSMVDTHAGTFEAGKFYYVFRQIAGTMRNFGDDDDGDIFSSDLKHKPPASEDLLLKASSRGSPLLERHFKAPWTPT